MISMIFRKAGTPNIIIDVWEEKDGWFVKETIDGSRESAWYEKPAVWRGPFTATQVQNFAVKEEWKLMDGRLVSEFKDFREIPEILEKEDAEKWHALTGSYASLTAFKEAVAVALVTDATTTIFDLAEWNGNNMWQSLKYVLYKEIKLSFDKENRGVAHDWKEAVEKYGFQIEPISKERLEDLREQAITQLRASNSKLIDRLSRLARPGNLSRINLQIK